jgi:hypothetical protein
MPSVRKITADGIVDYITDPSGDLESRLAQGNLRAELDNGDTVGVEALTSYERLDAPFEISGVTIAPGGYSYPEFHAFYGFGPQRKLSGIVQVERGSFYDGTRTGISTSRGRIQITPRIIMEPGLTIDWVNLPTGRFTSTLLTTRTSFAVTPRMGAAVLAQYNSTASTLSTNVRFRWEYRPGSDFFVVFNDNRDTTPRGLPSLRGRGVVVKVTRLFRL